MSAPVTGLPADETLVIVPEPSVDWRAVIAGAVVATGVSTTLLAFGSGIGLSTASTAPTWRDVSPTLWVVTGLYLVLVALCSFGAGGYITGRIRTANRAAAPRAEDSFRDGIHGLLTWGLAVMLSAFIAIGGAAVASRSLGNTGSTSVVGESTLASELDELFRGSRDTNAALLTLRRDEAARILLKSSSHDGVPDADRAYLTGLIGNEAALSVPDATARVNDIIGKSTLALHRARQALVMQAFMIGAALILGAAIAWFAATEGGDERERGVVPDWAIPKTARR